MDPVSAFGVAAAVAQFMSLGLAVAQRLAEYANTAPTDVPRALQNINIQLPLLLNSLSRVKTEEDVSQYDVDTRCMLRGVVSGCLRLVQDIEVIAKKLTPEPGEHIRTKLKKVLSSLGSDEKIADIDRGLQTYIQVLILHHVVDRHEAEIVPVEDHGYFEVKEKFAPDYVSRDVYIDDLDKAFHATIRRQKDRPQYIILNGPRGSGKTQLALGYCHEAYNAHQFRTIFWLDGSTPEALELSLEGAAAAIRRKRDGTRKEKIDFVTHFLERRWEPWLLLIDNYVEGAFVSDDISSWLPRTGYGGVLLVTTAETLPQVPAVHMKPFLNESRASHLRMLTTGAVEHGELKVVESAIAEGLDVNQKNQNGWYPLTRAALHGYEEMVKALLAAGANPNIDPNMISALVFAAGQGHATVVEMILNYEDEHQLRAPNEEYSDAVVKAVSEGRVEVVKVLLKHRSSALDMNGEKIASGFARCAREGKLELLEYLCSKGWVPASEEAKANAVVSAADSGHLEIVKYLVGTASFPVNVPNEYSKPVLLGAAGLHDGDSSKRDELVSFLLAAGADPNLKGQDGETPLQAAALREFTTTVKLLLQAGADPTTADNLGFTPLLASSKYKSPTCFPILTAVEIPDEEKRQKYFESALFFGARTGDRELLVSVVGKANLNAIQDYGSCTALMLAIKGKHLQAARYLVRKGASQVIKDKDGKLPLFVAAEAGLDLLVRDLVKAKDSPGVDVMDEKGNTALILAAGGNHELVVAELLKLQADREKENNVGDRAIDVAEEKRLEKIIKLLEDL